MNTLPDAIRLADWVDSYRTRKATVLENVSAELRRLHEVNQMLVEALEQILDEPNNTMSDGKALKEIIRTARSALAKAKEQA